MWPVTTGQAVYLDSNIFIYAVQKSDHWAKPAEVLLKAIDEQKVRAVASELVLAEVLSKPFALGNTTQIEQYQRLLSSGTGLSMVNVSRDVLVLAAQLRGEMGFKLFDAIHVATARFARCDYFLTQDERLGRALSDQPRWLKLSEIK
jgi:predicted nucleic acid-binding protein